MAIFKFNKEDSLELLEAAVSRKKQLTIVKDSGAYLMVFGETDVEGSENIVKYLKGMNPETDPDYYEECRFIFGGDDFGQDIGDQELFEKILNIKGEWRNLRFHLTSNYFKLSVK